MIRFKMKNLGEEIINARIDGMLTRAEENGEKNGKKEGRKELITTLLKSMTPEEISEKTEIPLNEIQKIKDNS